MEAELLPAIGFQALPGYRSIFNFPANCREGFRIKGSNSNYKSKILAKSQNSFIKKQLEQKKLKKKKEKVERKQNRKENSTGGSLDAMIAYIDEFGNISSTPPVPPAPDKK